MTDLGLLPIQFVTVLLIFMRVLGMFTAAPIFGHAHVPPQVKIGLALTISLALLSVVPQPPAILAENVWLLAAAAVKEAAVGIILGFVATMVFMAIQLAGELALSRGGAIAFAVDGADRMTVLFQYGNLPWSRASFPGGDTLGTRRRPGSSGGGRSSPGLH